MCTKITEIHFLTHSSSKIHIIIELYVVLGLFKYSLAFYGIRSPYIKLTGL